MAEERPGIHIDSDWKKQAQEEKRRLAEQEAQSRKAAATAPAGVVAGPKAPAGARGGRGERAAARERRELPPPSFTTLVQSLVTQVLLYLGELNQRGMDMMDLDLARHHLDTLAVLEEKTRGNLTPEEQAMLDNALYEVRMRFVSIASQLAQLP